jgi:hypothetical protein
MTRSLSVVLGRPTMTPNVQVLLQMGYLITVNQELQLGFVLLMKLRTFTGLYLSSQPTVDSST